jgi:hypothetical protein
MEELKHAIQAAGGVSALARALNVSQNRVSNWLTRGSVPDGWLEVIRMRFPIASAAPDGADTAHPPETSEA